MTNIIGFLNEKNMRIHEENNFKPEESCNEKEFGCETGKCISRNHRCNEVNDCEDGRDEKYKCWG